MKDINIITCYHETPHEIALEFGNHIISFLVNSKHSIFDKNVVTILDIFAGDGRLGNVISQKGSIHHKNIRTTFVEIDRTKLEIIKPYFINSKIININAFHWSPIEKYDLIVTNPPFEILNVNKSKILGFSWDTVKRAAKNLYGLSILKCIDLCSDGGIVAVIAPFSWIRGVYSSHFREDIRRNCTEVFITAFKHRGIFKNVIQDIGFQIFIKRARSDTQKCKIFFSYNGSKNRVINPDDSEVENANNLIKVRVGSVVWNRKKEFLTLKNNNESALIIYGGNIDHNGNLDLKNVKYSQKQYILNKGITNKDIINRPVILIRRTLRGHPGEWKIDSCLLIDYLRCTIENHIIIVEILSNQIRYKDFYHNLMISLQDYYFYAGSPNISTRIVRHFANLLIRDYLL